MQIYFMRHGEAYSSSEDPKRSLNRRGIEQATQIAQFLKDQAIPIKAIYHSTKPRAIETAQIIAQAYPEVAAMYPLDQLGPDHNYKDLCDLISQWQEMPDGSLFVGHLPNLEILCNFLINNDIHSPSVGFATATVVGLTKTDHRWRLQCYIAPDLLAMHDNDPDQSWWLYS
jgi:phosphohistidine phosphatase